MTETIERLRLAADDGHVESMYLLGVAFASGRHVERSYVTAARWFHMASRKGHARAKTSLAYLYSTGKGVRRDLIIAYVFFQEAAAGGDVLATDMREKLRRQMNPQQIGEAEKRARL